MSATAVRCKLQRMQQVMHSMLQEKVSWEQIRWLFEDVGVPQPDWSVVPQLKLRYAKPLS